MQGEIINAFPEQNHDAHIMVHVLFMKSPIVATTPNVMGIFYAHIQEHISMKAQTVLQQELQAQQQQQMAASLGAIDPSMVAPPMSQQMIESRIAELEVQFNQEFMQMMAPPEGQQDPLVAIRQQELAIRAAEAQRNAELDQQKMDLEQQKLRQRAVTDAARLETQEEIAEQRDDTNRERIQSQRDLAFLRRR